MAQIKDLAGEFLAEKSKNTRFLILATVNDENSPAVRTLGSWGLAGSTLYFGTSPLTEKVTHIRSNGVVNALIQPEGQGLESFVNISISGTAIEALDARARQDAISAISNHSSRFKERVEKNLINDLTFFKIDPDEIKVLDFGAGKGSRAVTVYSSTTAE